MFVYVCSGKCVEGKMPSPSGCSKCSMEPVPYDLVCKVCTKQFQSMTVATLCIACFGMAVMNDRLCLKCREKKEQNKPCETCAREDQWYGL